MKTTKKNDNNFAIAYYRFSSHAQNEASIDQQREQAEKYAEAHDLKIIKEYEDRAISGTTDARPGFQLMLSEIGKIKPAALIIWKTDRLGRDRYILALAKKTIRDAGCSIHYVAEAMPSDSPEGVLMEGLFESMAEFFSQQLCQNVTRGLHYNAENAFYNGVKLLGYKKGDDKHYAIDDKTAPVAQRIFKEYADGKPMADIAKDLNEQGIKTSRGRKFTINGLRSILKNRSYIGEYHYSDIVIPGGMPALVSEELFDTVQERFKKNKRMGRQRAQELSESDSPRFWLTGKLYCGECGSSIHGMSGTSKQGTKHYYYACKQHRKHKCDLKPIKKDLIENLVIKVLDIFLSDTENLASIAVDVANYYQKLNDDNGYIDSLKQQRKETEKALSNLVKAIEMGIFSESTQTRLAELENQKKLLTEAIEAEEIKQNIAKDDNSIRKYFDMYRNANFKDEETRNTILEYFVDKIYLYNDRLVVTCYYNDERVEVKLDEVADATTTVECSTASFFSPLLNSFIQRGSFSLCDFSCDTFSK